MDDKLLSFVGEKHYPFVKRMDDYLKLLREIHSSSLLNEKFLLPILRIKKENMEKEIEIFLKENGYDKKIPDFYANIIKEKIVKLEKLKNLHFFYYTLPSFC